MRYINRLFTYLLTYLLTYLVFIQDTTLGKEETTVRHQPLVMLVVNDQQYLAVILVLHDSAWWRHGTRHTAAADTGGT